MSKRECHWNEDKFKDALFDAMLELQIKRMPKIKELKSMEPIESSGRTVTGETIIRLISEFGGIKCVAEQYRLPLSTTKKGDGSQLFQVDALRLS